MKKFFLLSSVVFFMVSNVLLAQRSLTVYKIPEGSTINIDGSKDDFWSTSSGFDEDQSNTIYHTKEGNENLVAPTDNYDLSSSWNLAYNDTAIFGFFTVQDDEIQEPGADVSWYHDKIEMYFKIGNFDPAGIEGDISDDCSNGIYQYDFPVNVVEGYTWGLNEICKDIQTGSAGWGSAIDIDNYMIEWYISFEGLKDENGEAFVPEDNATVWFEPHIHDNDNTDYAEVNPRTRSYWSLDGQPGSATGGHAWEADAWRTGNIGTITFSATELNNSALVGIPAVTASNTGVYPNPVINMLNIKGDISHIRVYDILGKLIDDFEVQGKKQVDISGYEKGIYILGLYQDNELDSTTKIIKL